MRAVSLIESASAVRRSWRASSMEVEQHDMRNGPLAAGAAALPRARSIAPLAVIGVFAGRNATSSSALQSKVQASLARGQAGAPSGRSMCRCSPNCIAHPARSPWSRCSPKKTKRDHDGNVERGRRNASGHTIYTAAEVSRKGWDGRPPHPQHGQDRTPHRPGRGHRRSGRAGGARLSRERVAREALPYRPKRRLIVYPDIGLSPHSNPGSICWFRARGKYEPDRAKRERVDAGESPIGTRCEQGIAAIDALGRVAVRDVVSPVDAPARRRPDCPEANRDIGCDERIKPVVHGQPEKPAGTPVSVTSPNAGRP